MVENDEIIDKYAKIIAEQVSGIRDAVPTEMDREIAFLVFDTVEHELLG